MKLNMGFNNPFIYTCKSCWTIAIYQLRTEGKEEVVVAGGSDEAGGRARSLDVVEIFSVERFVQFVWSSANRIHVFYVTKTAPLQWRVERGQSAANRNIRGDRGALPRLVPHRGRQNSRFHQEHLAGQHLQVKILAAFLV